MTTAEADVRAVLDRLTEAWNDGDATAYGRLFTEDADYVTFFGLNTPGREQIEKVHRALFEGPLKGSKLTGGGAVQVRFVRPDVAVAVAGGGSSLARAGTGDDDRASTVTFVLVHEGDEWLITAFQNTRVSDPRS